jgi:hypothetical protein
MPAFGNTQITKSPLASTRRLGSIVRFASPMKELKLFEIGLVMPLTGVLAPVGKQAVAGARLYVAQHGDVVAGRKVTLIARDDASIPDVSKRVAQELIVNEKIDIIGGGITPSVLAIAPLATESKTATVVMVSGTSIVTERSRRPCRVHSGSTPELATGERMRCELSASGPPNWISMCSKTKT